MLFRDVSNILLLCQFLSNGKLGGAQPAIYLYKICNIIKYYYRLAFMVAETTNQLQLRLGYQASCF